MSCSGRRRSGWTDRTPERREELATQLTMLSERIIRCSREWEWQFDGYVKPHMYVCQFIQLRSEPPLAADSVLFDCDHLSERPIVSTVTAPGSHGQLRVRGRRIVNSAPLPAAAGDRNRRLIMTDAAGSTGGRFASGAIRPPWVPADPEAASCFRATRRDGAGVWLGYCGLSPWFILLLKYNSEPEESTLRLALCMKSYIRRPFWHDLEDVEIFPLHFSMIPEKNKHLSGASRHAAISSGVVGRGC